MMKFFAPFLIATGVFLPATIKAQTNPWRTVVAGEGFGLGLREDGTLWAWGWNRHGSLGDGTTQNRSSPVLTRTENKWLQVAAGEAHSLGIASDGTLWSWGVNLYAQLGDGTHTSRSLPARISTDRNWVAVAAGGWHGTGLKADGTLWAWGRNNTGQLGDGTYLERNRPVQIGTDQDWIKLSSGNYHNLAIKADGTLWAWGLNGNGQLGDGSGMTSRNRPIQIGTDRDWVAVSAGGSHSMGLKADGTLWAWGYNYYGQVGNGTLGNNKQPAPVQIGTDQDWRVIATGHYHSLALKADSTLWIWGLNDYGELGNGTSRTFQSSPIRIGTDRWVNISGGADFTLGLKADRSQLCAAGINFEGQLGDNSTIHKTLFVCTTSPDCTPPPAPTAVNQMICSGSQASLAASGRGTLSWYRSAMGGTCLGTGAAYQTPPLTTTTTYYVQDSTCAVSVNRTPVLIRVNPLPEPPGLPAIDQPIRCNPSPRATVSLSAPASSATAYEWKIEPAAAGSITGSGLSATVQWQEDFLGEATIRARGINDCGPGRYGSALTVTMGTLPAAVRGELHRPGRICAGQTQLPFSIDAVADASQYHWLLPPGVKFTEGTPTTGNHILLDLEDNFEGGTLSVAGKNGCGVGKMASFVLSAPARITAGQPIRGNDTLCAGQPGAVFTTNPLENATSYHWKLQLGSGPVALVTAEPTLTINVPDQAQSGSLSVAGSNACRTGMYSPPFSFTIGTAPAGEVAGPREVCPGKATVEYSTEPMAGCRSYDWKLPAHVRPLDGSTVTYANRISVQILDGFTGGTIQVSATNRCGSSIPAAGLSVRAMPALQVPILSQSCNTLHVQAQAYPLQWYVDEMPVGGQTDKQLTLRQKGTYTVRIFGPCDTTSASLVAEPIIPTPEDVPNVFSPNGDKWNQTFQLADKLKGASLVVQNRWGRVVYESSNYQNDWDGQELSPGVYYYYLKISCQSQAVRGIVHLLR